MSKSMKADLSVCEKSMAVMFSILKISTLSLSHLTVNHLGVDGNGKVRPAAGQFSVGSPLLNPVKASLTQQAYLLEPEIREKPRAVSVDRVKPVKPDLNQRSSDYIEDVRRKISSEVDSEKEDVLRKAKRPIINKLNAKQRNKGNLPSV